MKNAFRMLTVAGLCMVNHAFAIPTIWPTEGTLVEIEQLENTTNSNLVADNVNPKKIYVMPPNSAKAIMQKHLFLRTANLGFCGEMKDLQGYTKRMSAQIADLDDVLKEKAAEKAKIIEKISKAREEVAKYAVEKRLTELSDLDNEISSINQHIDALNAELKTCSSKCDTLEEQLDKRLADHSSALKRRRELARIHTASLTQYERKRQLLEGLKEDLADLDQSYTDMENDLIGIRSKLFNAYKDLGSLEAGRAAISYTSSWDENINTLQEANKGYSFEKITTQDAVFTTDIADLSHVPSGSAILAYKISACNNDGAGKCETSTYPENFSGSVVLSTIGACPIEHPDYFDLDMDHPNSAEEMSFGMTVAYDYPTAMTVEAKVEYNMYKMYQKIVKSGKKGGLFSSRSWNSVKEKTFFRDDYSVTWSDQAQLLPETEKDVIEQEMRNAIFDRMAKLALSTATNPAALVIPHLPASGATVLGNEMAKNKACQTNIYCTAASIGVKVLDAIFGGGKTTSSYTNIQDVKLEDNWSRTSVVYKPYITSYLK